MELRECVRAFSVSMCKKEAEMCGIFCAEYTESHAHVRVEGKIRFAVLSEILKNHGKIVGDLRACHMQQQG
jgi:hypothetical protein